MCRIRIACLVLLCLFVGFAAASPGDYALRVKAGPSFQMRDWHNQVRLGSEFDYELGYSMGVGLLALFGASGDFRFQLIPNFRYDLVYIGPATIFGTVGAGYGRFNKEDALDLRIATGMVLPLGDRYEVSSDVNWFISPIGTPGTPMTLDWLISFGLKFR